MMTGDESMLPADEVSKSALRERKEWATRRFMAKMIDNVIVGLLIGAPVNFGVSHMSVSLSFFLTSFVQMAGEIVFDASMIANFSATPGKYLCAISICAPGGENLSLRAAWRRAWLSALYGQALGLFFVQPYLQWRSYKRLLRVGKTSWDELTPPTMKQPSDWQRHTIRALITLSVYVPLFCLLVLFVCGAVVLLFRP